MRNCREVRDSLGKVTLQGAVGVKPPGVCVPATDAMLGRQVPEAEAVADSSGYNSFLDEDFRQHISESFIKTSTCIKAQWQRFQPCFQIKQRGFLNFHIWTPKT